jgi:fructoselysine-6-P-deglycase FrlB-like protein
MTGTAAAELLDGEYKNPYHCQELNPSHAIHNQKLTTEISLVICILSSEQGNTPEVVKWI